jgi:hypothetical protein
LRYKSKSEVPKKGEGDAHSRGKRRVVQTLENYFKYNTGKKGIFKETAIDEEYTFMTRITVSLMNEYPWIHDYDIMLKLLYNNGLKKILAIEVDGSTHEKPEQKAKDDIAEDIFYLVHKLDQRRKNPDFDDCHIQRIPLSDALGPQEELEKLLSKLF